MIKNRCSPISQVLFIAIGAFLICTVSAQAGGPSAAAGASSNGMTASVRSVQPAVSGSVGLFAINPFPDTCVPATDPSCAFYDVCVKEAGNLNNANCTANDVQLTEIIEGSLEVLPDLDGGIGCDGLSDAADPQCPWGGDCVTFTATGHYVLTSQTRYDIGTFLALFPNSATQNGARSGECLRFAYTNGDTLALDTDSCGDLDQATAGLAAGGKNIDFGPVTVPCVSDAEGNIVINHCETWSQRNNEIICNGSDDVKAGTAAKCNCGVLSGICIAVNSGNACITNVCRGACQPASGTGGSGTDCSSSADCTAPETCQDIVLVGDTKECPAPEECFEQGTCDPETGICSTPFSDAGTTCGNPASTDPLLPCDADDSCDGSGVCVDRVRLGNNSVECRASDGSLCDPAEFCNGTDKTCPGNICLGGTPHPS